MHSPLMTGQSHCMPRLWAYTIVRAILDHLPKCVCNGKGHCGRQPWHHGRQWHLGRATTSDLLMVPIITCLIQQPQSLHGL